MSTALPTTLSPYELEDRFRYTEGRVFLSGTQALVALMLMQRRLDEKQRLNTAGFVSGYRGSPLGAVDQAFWRAKTFLKDSQINFMPAINEDLAATAVLGTQQVETEATREVDGVFSMWYGKGPGSYVFIGGTGKWQGIVGYGKTLGMLRGRTDDHFMLKSQMHWGFMED